LQRKGLVPFDDLQNAEKEKWWRPLLSVVAPLKPRPLMAKRKPLLVIEGLEDEPPMENLPLPFTELIRAVRTRGLDVNNAIECVGNLEKELTMSRLRINELEERLLVLDVVNEGRRISQRAAIDRLKVFEAAQASNMKKVFAIRVISFLLLVTCLIAVFVHDTKILISGGIHGIIAFMIALLCILIFISDLFDAVTYKKEC
jgi:hypothetical protein